MAIEMARVMADVVVRIAETSFDVFWYLAARMSSVLYSGSSRLGDRRADEKEEE